MNCYYGVLTPNSSSEGGGTSNYQDLENKPRINGVELTGNKTSGDLKISAEEKVVSHGTNDATFELPPNEYHKWEQVPELTLTLKAPINNEIVNEYHFSFDSGATATVLSLPEQVQTDIVVESNTHYECSIVDDYMVFNDWGVVSA